MQHNYMSMPGPRQLAVMPLHGAAYNVAAPTLQHGYELSLPSPGKNNLDMDAVLSARLKEIAIRPKDMLVAGNCFRHLKEAAKQLGDGLCIRPFGSISNGFGKRGCDLDATCCWDGTTKLTSMPMPPDPSNLLEGLLPIIQNNEQFKILKEIKFARVPILKLKFMHKEQDTVQELEVDLSFQNTEPFSNTQLLRTYTFIGSNSQDRTPVRDLGLLVKLWAEAVGVCGAPNGNLSAYSFTLMSIYFLQVEPNIRLPCLSTHYFNGGDGIPQQYQSLRWSCSLSMSALLHRFFHFFVEEFRWGTEVVSIRVGRRTMADDTIFSQLRGRFDRRLHIEDPFLTTQNLHCVLRQEQEAILIEKLWEALGNMQQGVLPVGLYCAREAWPSRPLAPRVYPEKDGQGQGQGQDLKPGPGPGLQGPALQPGGASGCLAALRLPGGSPGVWHGQPGGGGSEKAAKVGGEAPRIGKSDSIVKVAAKDTEAVPAVARHPGGEDNGAGGYSKTSGEGKSNKLAGPAKTNRELNVEGPAPKDLPLTKLLQGKWAF